MKKTIWTYLGLLLLATSCILIGVGCRQCLVNPQLIKAVIIK